MNLSQLEVLVAIVDTGSLTEAAEVVSLTQSAVSHSLNRLESELGVTLLERGRQGITVTGIGEEVVQHARSVIKQVEIIRQKTNRERGLSVGKVRFGVVPNIAARLLTGILRDFQHKYPEIEIVLFEGNPHELLEWLETDVIDVGTVLVPEHYANTVRFASVEIKVIVSNDHPLAQKDAIPMAALSDYPLIGPRSQYRMFSGLLAQRNLSMPKLRYEVSAYNTILTMVRENMGISMMPEMLIDTKLEGVMTIPFNPSVKLNVYLASHLDSPITSTFMDNAHTWAKEQGFLPD